MNERNFSCVARKDRKKERNNYRSPLRSLNKRLATKGGDVGEGREGGGRGIDRIWADGEGSKGSPVKGGAGRGLWAAMTPTCTKLRSFFAQRQSPGGRRSESWEETGVCSWRAAGRVGWTGEVCFTEMMSEMVFLFHVKLGAWSISVRFYPVLYSTRCYFCPSALLSVSCLYKMLRTRGGREQGRDTGAKSKAH